MSYLIVVSQDTLAGEPPLLERLDGRVKVGIRQHKSNSLELGFWKDLAGLHDNNHTKLVMPILLICSVWATTKQKTQQERMQRRT